MTTVSYPGVYVQEVPGGARPIEVASTSTAAFVGVAQKGDDARAVRVTSWQDYERVFGSFVSAGYLAESVYQFFNNGGRQCYVLRVTGSGAVAAHVDVANRESTPVLGARFAANSKGAWGNSLFLRITDGTEDTGNTFNVSVYVQDDAGNIETDETANAATPAEVHENLDMDIDSPRYFATRIGEDSGLIVASLLAGNTALTSGRHVGGANPQTTIPAGRRLEINVDGDGFQAVTLGAATDLAAIATEIETAVRALTKRKNSTDAAAFTGFTCTATGGVLVLTSGSSSASSSVEVRRAGSDVGAEELRLGAAFGGVSTSAVAVRRPAIGIYHVGDHPTDAQLGADDVGSLTPQSFVDAFPRLDDITDVSLLAVPGVPGVYDDAVAYCENRPLRDVFFIGETEITDDTPAEAEAFRRGIAKPNTYGCVFFPWIQAADLTGAQAEPVLLPPSGFLAGLFARIDSTRGVWKAPAGVEASVNGAKGLAFELTDVQQGNLNRIGVNCLRRFALAGIVSWGARTVHSDPEYKYVPVRRTAIMLRRSIYDGIQWAVFEPNDHRLWSALRLNIGAFMNGLFRAGAFQGEKASDAYFVRCGLGSTMTQGDIDRGIVYVEVGFAALKPAEFVVVRIQQKAGQNQ